MVRRSRSDTRSRSPSSSSTRQEVWRRTRAQLAPAFSGVKLTKRVIHVVGSRVKPRVTKLKLRLNVAASVVVKVRGTSKATGKKVVARLPKTTQAAGASTIKLTGKVGKKRLPPGTYTVTVRATNPIGTATASAGRLKVKP